MSQASNRVTLVEVGPRDGLQNERQIIPTATKVDLVERLIGCGLRRIEATAFVSPRRVPQMADHAEVMQALPKRPGVRYGVLTPNVKGYEAAIRAGAEEAHVFASASEAFSQRNIECSVAESFARFEPIFASAEAAGVLVRGSVSCALGCPYEGEVAPARVAEIAARLFEMGCYEVSLADTIGVGTPASVLRVIDAVSQHVPVERLATHFHDTYGMGVANVYAAYGAGVRVFDGSVAGLGGCPYARGATGNVATEDLVYLMNGLGVETGVDLDALVDCASFITEKLGRSAMSRVASAWRAKRALAAE